MNRCFSYQLVWHQLIYSNKSLFFLKDYTCTSTCYSVFCSGSHILTAFITRYRTFVFKNTFRRLLSVKVRPDVLSWSESLSWIPRLYGSIRIGGVEQARSAVSTWVCSFLSEARTRGSIGWYPRMVEVPCDGSTIENSPGVRAANRYWNRIV